MHTALRALSLLAVAGALGGGLLIFATDAPQSQLAAGAVAEIPMTLSLTSSAFEHESPIPARYTCDADNVNPPLVIRGVPEGAKSLVLIMEDPDVPTVIRADGMWDHWVAFNIPPDTVAIPEHSEPAGVLGVGSGGMPGYKGPCPPNGEHRYLFKLFALDAMLDLAPGVTKAQVVDAMQGHIVAEATLMGRYARGEKE